MPSEAILTVDQMRAAEQAAMDSGTSEWDLMKRAGKGAGQWVARMAAGRAVCVLCGPGNNGGDGYVIAEFLRAQGNEVKVIAPKPPGSETARSARDHFCGTVLEEGELDAPVIVDCLFGYGLSREVKWAFAVLLKELESADAFKIAVDVPSSIASDSGEAMGPVVHYDLTLALGAWKHAHVTMPAMARMGMKRLVDIGLSPARDAPSLSQAPRLSAPAADAHKYRRGLLAVVAGEMPGAPILAGQAAMRCGAGYVKLFSDHSHPDAPVDLVIEDGPLDEGLADDRIAAVLIGPGLGRSEASRQRLEQALACCHRAILDADALHLLDPALLERTDARKIVVTPHEGELAALCKAFGIAGNTKLERARGLHEATGMTVLAKGPDTVLVGAEGAKFFPRGTSWLSVAGSGDVLAGMAASRLAVDGDGFSACEEAVWLHHEAARLSKPAFTASELADNAAAALEAFL
ncbi:NAD(P)H-hydrate dehydratase [Qipengyuania sp. GH1]|uniref:NAD(P)H-hydrate dehydratase n=1 Tax=Qipengyuania aestuarii TaxID=2867241 RepID=UPI001C867DE0|nr:NAD(P)H-hydrate dehydratase [Qipengyuania aestuarii]MBX7534406.1 NAD(P)H-hydrate dehydratase [Qipengyuania aestuarii]